MEFDKARVLRESTLTALLHDSRAIRMRVLEVAIACDSSLQPTEEAYASVYFRVAQLIRAVEAILLGTEEPIAAPSDHEYEVLEHIRDCVAALSNCSVGKVER